MFRLFFFFMFVWLCVFGCAGDDPDPVGIISVSPVDGSTIEPQDSIVVKFTNIPENLQIYADSRDISDQLSLDGRVATIRAPFSDLENSSEFTKIVEGLELKLAWGRPDLERRRRLKFSVQPRQPHWTDGKLTIQIGNYKTQEEIIKAMKKNKFGLGVIVEYNLRNRDFYLSGKRYTIEVEVIKMFDVGLTEETTYEEIYKRYRERGCRPLTPEEVMELRLQLLNQPPKASGHLMSAFFALIDPKLGEDGHEIYTINGHLHGKHTKGGVGSRSIKSILDPATSGVITLDPPGAMPEVRFAVVKE